MKLGFIGLGIMGTPMAINLARAGHQLHVTTIGPVADELLSLGAVSVETARQVTEASDIIFIMVPDTPQVEEVLFGENGCTKASLKGKTIVDMSSISPIETKRFARQVNELGGDYLDAPVSGGEIGAREGTLSIMVGGDEAVFERVKPLFNGEIDCLVSDHSPCPPEMKAGNIMEAWGGIAGLQNCMDVMFDEAVQKRGMSLPMFGKLMATNAADIFGLQQKGRIAPGKDADFVFIQPNSSYVLTNDDLEYRHKVSPYVGRTIGARITKTILRGDVIYDIEQGFPVAPKGQFILKHQQ